MHCICLLNKIKINKNKPKESNLQANKQWLPPTNLMEARNLHLETSFDSVGSIMLKPHVIHNSNRMIAKQKSCSYTSMRNNHHGCHILQYECIRSWCRKKEQDLQANVISDFSIILEEKKWKFYNLTIYRSQLENPTFDNICKFHGYILKGKT